MRFQGMAECAYTEYKRHEPTQDCEQDVAPLIAEASSSLKKNESGYKQRPNGVQQGPVHRGQQAASCSLPLALCMC